MLDDRFIKTLKKELPIWQKKKIISQDNSQKLLEYYESGNLMKENKSNRFIQIISVIGSVLLGVGILLFVGSNWSLMSAFFKTLLLIGSMIIFYSLGYYFYYYKETYQKTGYALIVLGSLIYGSSIFLLGQIYNLGGQFSDGLLYWLLGIFPLIYLTGFSILLIEGIVLLYLFVVMFLADNYSYDLEEMVIFVISAISIFNIAFAQLHTSERLEHFKKYLHIGGMMVLFFCTFLFSFKDLLRSIDVSSGVPLIFFIGFIVLGIGLRLYHNYKQKRFELLNDIGFLIHIVYIIFIMLIGSLQLSGEAMNLILIGTNIYFILMILYSIYIGVRRSTPYLINISLFYFVLFVLVKYFEMFWEMFDRSLFFIGGGLILLIGGMYLEKRRKKLLEQVKS